LLSVRDHIEAILMNVHLFRRPADIEKIRRATTEWLRKAVKMLDDLKLHFSEVRNVFGPAWLVMMADVDAASVITAMQSGASFKYGLILILIALVIPLYFIMEVAGRVGAVTKRGLGELVRENFSRKLSIALSFPMAITDFLSYGGVRRDGSGLGLSRNTATHLIANHIRDTHPHRLQAGI
jgi:Natural resistance-associated macrophage protein